MKTDASLPVLATTPDRETLADLYERRDAMRSTIPSYTSARDASAVMAKVADLNDQIATVEARVLAEVK